MRDLSKVALVTHKGCLDGTGCAFIFLLAGGNINNVLFRAPSNVLLKNEDLAADIDTVLYADCCPHTFENPAAGRNFKILDHHISNMRTFSSDDRCVFNMQKCGTTILYDFLKEIISMTNVNASIGFERFIKAIEDYDLGKFENADGIFLADLANSFSQEDFLNVLMRTALSIFQNESLIARAATMQSLKKLFCDSIKIHKTSINGYTAGIVLSPVYWKNACAEKVLQDLSVSLAVIIDINGNMVSLRSRSDGPDCSRLAQEYGGGGHARAAGFKINSSIVISDMIENILQ